MIRSLVSFILFSILFAPAYAESKVDIYAPEHETRVTDETIWLVASTTSDPKKITVVLKNKGGVKEIKGKVHKDIFHALLSLKPGLNEITVGEKTLSLIYSSKHVRAGKSTKKKKGLPKYPPYLFHTPEKERKCSECHQMVDIKADSKAVSQPSCVKCHAELLTSVSYLHGPLGGQACLICHDAESSPSKFAPKFDGKGELCFGCHEEMKTKLSERKYFHGPVGVNDCAACHDPHGSSFRYQLVEKGKYLCYLCHDQKRVLGGKIVHDAVKHNGCEACHDPHSSNYKAHLVTDERSLCVSPECHPRFKKITMGHPVANHPLRSVRDPLRPEREFSCSSCHNPHSSDFSLLLPGEEYSFCSKCH